MKEFSKKYIPQNIEHEIKLGWESQNFFYSKNKKNFSIAGLALPTSSYLHLGHAVNLVLEDVLARYYHMQNKQVNFWISWYYGSFLTNEIVERQLIQIGTNNKKISKAQFWNIMQQQIQKQKKYNENQLKKLGILINAKNSYSQFEIGFSRFLRKLFYQLVQDDIIYEDEDIVYRNTKYQTSLGSDEVKFEKQKGKKYTIKYFISTKNNSVDIITTTPETIFGDVALAVNPNNKRYHNLVGKKAIIPIVNRTIPIIADSRVDMFANNGIMRITPAHDLLSLQIAKDHKLPTDQFAIEENGCFSKLAGDFAGKKVDEFMENILQNLDDIDNLVAVEDCEFEVPICKKTGEKLQTMCLVQWFFDTSKVKEHLLSLIDDQSINIYPDKYRETLKQNVDIVKKWCISKNYFFGQNLPIRISENKGMIYVFDEGDVLEMYKKDKNKKKLKIILSLIIFNLIADGYLNSIFEIDDLITILLGLNIDTKKTIFETYIDIIEKDITGYASQIKELKELLQNVNKEKQSYLENFVAGFIKILDSSFALKQITHQKYQFDIDKLITKDKGLKQEKRKFDISFVNAVLFLYAAKIFEQEKSKSKANIQPTILVTGEHSFLEVGKILFLSLRLKNILPFQKIFINKTFCDHKKHKMGTFCTNNKDPNILHKEFGADVARLYLLFSGDENVSYFNYNEIFSYQEFINQFWNAARYVAYTTKESFEKKKIMLSSLEKEIAKNLADLNDFDTWILNKIKSLYEEIHIAISSNNIIEFGKKFLQIVKNDFCDKYLEITKNSKSPYTNQIMIFIIGKILKIFRLFAPFISEKLWNLLGFQAHIYEQNIEKSFLDKLNKNYKIQIFMDILDKFLSIKKKLACKKHSGVDIFIKANPDFLKFSKTNEAIIKKIINSKKIEYLHSNEKHGHEYITEDIIDITIGLKISEENSKEENQSLKSTKSLNQLQKEFEEMNDYLQFLKNLVSTMMLNKSDPNEIEKKKKEIAKIKKNLLNIEYEIKKLKLHK